MGRPATGSIVQRPGKTGTTLAVRVHAYGRRWYVSLGRLEDGWTYERADGYRADVLADVDAGVWMPPRPEASGWVPPEAVIARLPRGERQIGDPAGTAYTLVRRALDALEQLRTSTDSRVVRRAVNEAMGSLYVAEDAVRRAKVAEAAA